MLISCVQLINKMLTKLKLSWRFDIYMYIIHLFEIVINKKIVKKPSILVDNVIFTGIGMKNPS